MVLLQLKIKEKVVIYKEEKDKIMPNRKAKDRKHLKKILSKWLNKYGRTKKQIEKYKKKHGADSIPPMPSY